MQTARVLSVGQCYADGPALEQAVTAQFKADFTHVDTAAEAFAQLDQHRVDLVLVNRLFDLDGASGIEFIRQLRAEPRTADVPVMLISNYPHYQAEAQALGAVPGFGKNALGQPSMVAALRPFLPAKVAKAG